MIVGETEDLAKQTVRASPLSALRVRGILGKLLEDPDIQALIPELKGKARLACNIRSVDDGATIDQGYSLHLGISETGLMILRCNNENYEKCVETSGRFVAQEYWSMSRLNLSFDGLKAKLMNHDNEFKFI